ncbi:MAG: Hsp20/alpha crystallin family protein [Acidobacteria bacterium]|nr:Hsp20/alpha crystallin family protein [Acidobacteriota bacterium]MCA1607939.1 Hsp20/alpha crystallin family protein [Acidobacteriota bacterium]
MARSFNRQFQFLATSKSVQSPARLWYPAADVYRTPDGWLVKVELAGVAVEDVEIEIHGNVLSIVGCRKDKSYAVGMTFQQMEITYSQFEKTLKFPASIEGASVEHNFENGLLIIKLWKAR